MKKIFTILFILIASIAIKAQSSDNISYQAIVRNAENELLVNQKVTVAISILQGSASGTNVYAEMHTTSTNTNGLITLLIGNEAATNGDFSTINWSAGPFFVQTDIDPAGGSNFTISSTSQLLSVPYALHAKTAERITEELSYTETDPLFSQSLAANITESDISKWNESMTDTKLSEAEVDAFVDNNGYLTAEVDGSITNEIQDLELTNNSLTITNNGAATTVDLSKYLDNTDGQTLALAGKTLTISDGNSVDLTSISTPSGYAVGDELYGGIVFYVDETGQHGLICAKEDQNSAIPWQYGSPSITGAHNTGIGGGYMNTMLIVAAQGGDPNSNYAAKVCSIYSTYINPIRYGGWYLPNVFELQLIQANKDAINTTAATMGGTDLAAEYWSSREGGATYDGNAQTVYMSGATGGRLKTTHKAARAIRAF